MRIDGDNPLAPRILAYDSDGKTVQQLSWIDLRTFDNADTMGKKRDVVEVTIVHPTGRKLRDEDRDGHQVRG